MKTIKTKYSVISIIFHFISRAAFTDSNGKLIQGSQEKKGKSKTPLLFFNKHKMGEKKTREKCHHLGIESQAMRLSICNDTFRFRLDCDFKIVILK